ncbi:hypothetical protein [Quadrisphaera setariae]|uniref:Uncharacterized protein n=1 Tax=Quadrisphaera setariae TaxID=2593304 RepID=A0A5C8ZIY7_9ACTN|nr:hypothetical protein [Quadrisphaera setariae]TXR58025.1 hypothetical protein FMM08_02050 [Quadrisphaera setariae]
MAAPDRAPATGAAGAVGARRAARAGRHPDGHAHRRGTGGLPPGAVRSVGRFAVEGLVALLLLQVVLLAGLIGAQAVPNAPIIRHLAEAVADGDYGPSYLPDGMGGRADRFTECVELGYGVSSPDDPRSLWFRATGGPRLESCGEGAAQVRAMAAGVQVLPPATYYRYWNGYALVTRPVLATLGVPGARMVSGALLAAAGLAAWAALRRRAGAAAACALVLPVAVSTNALAMPALAFTHALALASIAAGVALTAVATGSERLRGWRGAAVGAGGAGALLAYTDLLTTPAMSWCLCAAAAGAVARGTARNRTGGEDRDDDAPLPLRGSSPAARTSTPTAVGAPALRPVLVSVLAAGAAWPVAYGVTWVSRWLVAAAVQGPGVFTAVRDKSAERLDGASSAVDPSFGAPTAANVERWLGTAPTAWTVLAVAAVVVLVCLVVAVLRGGAGRLLVAAVLAAPALVVPAWYEVLSNHSQVHAFFTYRSLPAAVGVVVAACLLAAAPGGGGAGARVNSA